MEKSFFKHHNIAAVVAIVLSVLILYLSLLEQKDIPKIQLRFIDKLVHIIMYFILFIFYLFGFFYGLRKGRDLFTTGFVAFSFSFLIEIFQKIFTQSRHFDIYDLVANFVGIIFAYFLIRMLRTEKSKL